MIGRQTVESFRIFDLGLMAHRVCILGKREVDMKRLSMEVEMMFVQIELIVARDIPVCTVGLFGCTVGLVVEYTAGLVVEYIVGLVVGYTVELVVGYIVGLYTAGLVAVDIGERTVGIVDLVVVICSAELFVAADIVVIDAADSGRKDWFGN